MRASISIFVLLFAMSLEAQAPKSFSKGVLAFEKREWQNAEKFMRETIAANPKESEGTVSISGLWSETYVPHYFLARALARQGKCEEALKEFAESERQGVTPTIPDFEKHLQSRDGCRSQPKTTKPREVMFETTVPFGDEGDAPRTTSVPRTTIAEPVAPRASPRPRVSAAPPAPAPGLEKERSRLAAGVTAYVRGRYEETARVLSETPFSDRAAAAEAALLRAAARHALYRSGGEKDAGLRAQVELDLRRYRELRPNGVPDPRIFAPGFIALTQTAKRKEQ